MPRCFIVDPDTGLAGSLAAYLEQCRSPVATVSDAATFRERFDPQSFDIVLLEARLPDGDGLDVCRWLRDRCDAFPLIMLGRDRAPVERVLGLELGADDYVSKPFDFRELLARIHAVLRRAPHDGDTSAGDGGVHFAGCCFDAERRMLVSADGRAARLPPLEFHLLEAFVGHPGRVLTRARLLALTRGASRRDATGRSVDIAVSRLRRRLGDHDRSLIKTVRSDGYVFDAVLAAR